MNEIVELSRVELEQYVNDDPVRPSIPLEDRIKPTRKTFAFKEDGKVQAVCCVAYGCGIPTQESDLHSFGNEKDDEPYVIMPYTVWTYNKGAGRELILGILDNVREQYASVSAQYKPRVITLSPKTDTAARFHIRNGARLLANNAETDNFEYEV